MEEQNSKSQKNIPGTDVDNEIPGPSNVTSSNQTNTHVEDERFNESLESYAKAYNLSALNVKNIIYHVIKNPETFPTLISKEGEALMSWRLTRSRWKKLEEVSNFKFDLEMKPLHKPKTFLDVDYGDNDDEDDDYQPQPEEEADEEDDDMELYNDEPINDILLEEMDIFRDDDQLLTAVDDPDYLNFVSSCLTPNPTLQMLDDENDDEYAPIYNEIDFAEEDEYRMDRSTKIPKWEVDALLEDLYQEDELHALLASPPGRSGSPSAVDHFQEPALHTENNVQAIKHASLPSTEEIPTVEIPGCLFNPNPKFSDEELQVLKVQLEKHVQLLTQAVIGCHGQHNLVKSYNTALKMIYELDEKMYEKDDENSIYKIRTLPDAILSCHEINSLSKVDLPIPKNLAKRSQSWPSSEIQWVLAKSSALKYPELIPDRCFDVFPPSNASFLVSEQLLLALALFELRHTKHSTWCNWNGKYHLISANFLPNKSVQQIKSHLRNQRGTLSSSKLPIQQILSQAKKGELIAEFRLDHGETARTGIPMEWPEEVQTDWLKNLSYMVHNGSVIMTPAFINLYQETNPVQQPQSTNNINGLFDKEHPIEVLENVNTTVNTEQTITTDAQASASLDYEAIPSTSGAVQKVNLLEQDEERITGEEVEMADETSNDRIFADEETESSKQKVKRKIDEKRKIKKNKGLKGLLDPTYKEQAWKAMIAAVEKDIRQRFFMHSAKLRELQRILSSNDITPREMFEQVHESLKSTHSHVVTLLSTILKSEDLPEWAQNSTRSAYLLAMETIINIQAYVAHSRNNTAAKYENITEEELRAKLYKFFGKDEPLWRLLRENILMSERFQEKIEDWEYEYIDMDAIKNDADMDMACQYECVEIPHQKESDERGLLQLRQGRMTMEHGGKQKTVHVSFGSDSGQTQTAAPWTRDDDRTLLTNYNLFGGDAQKAVEAFVAGKKTVSGLEASRRLSYLLSLFSKV